MTEQPPSRRELEDGFVQAGEAILAAEQRRRDEAAAMARHGDALAAREFAEAVAPLFENDDTNPEGE